MSFTYSAVELLESPTWQVRLEIGDVDEDAALFQDEEIEAKLAGRADNVLLTAADLCDILARRFARDYDFSTDGQSFSRSQMSRAYLQLAKDLRTRASGLTTISTTRVDGYSQDIANQDVFTTGRNPRRRYYGQEDDLP